MGFTTKQEKFQKPQTTPFRGPTNQENSKQIIKIRPILIKQGNFQKPQTPPPPFKGIFPKQIIKISVFTMKQKFTDLYGVMNNVCGQHCNQHCSQRCVPAYTLLTRSFVRYLYN